ncbi:hypothetical protein C0995_014723, partial [Termitomyces sp. Mi166
MLFPAFAATLLVQGSLVTGWDTFVVPHTDGQDDMPGLVAAIGNHSTNSTILFQKGVHYNIFTPIKFPVLNNVEIRIEGNLSYPTDIPTIQDPNWGWIDGHGQAWWDTQNQVNRPHGIAFSNIRNGVIRDIKLWKPIAWNFATSGSTNLHAFNNKIVAVSSNPNVSAFPFNTDGKNTYCEGGHGLSIGSLGKGGSVADVQDVLIENIVMNKTLYGARFKSWTGGNGLARNVTWRNITFSNVRFPIYVTQNYWDQNLGPAPNSTSTNNTHIQDFLFDNLVGVIDDSPNYFEGSCVSDPCWYFVEDATGREVVIYDLYHNT